MFRSIFHSLLLLTALFATNASATHNPRSLNHMHTWKHFSNITGSNSTNSNSTNTTGATMTHNGYRSVAYYGNWDTYTMNYQIQDLPSDKLTHVLYGFANITAEGEVTLSDKYADLEKRFATDNWNMPEDGLYGNLKQMYLLKKRNRNMKALLTIGGWTYSPNFTTPMATDQGRRTFASSSVQLLKDLGFDGIDIDWEYPANDAQAQQYVDLLAAVREALDSYSGTLPSRPHFLLTIAAPAGPQSYAPYKFREMDQYLDFWNLMAYDFAGSWSSVAGHQANLYPSKSTPLSTPFSADTAVRAYIAKGVPACKIILGMPLYGRAFTNTNGPSTPFSGIGQGSWENGTWDYKVLPFENCQVLYDDQAQASWSYDNNTKTMITYDSPEAVANKTEYIKQKALGGGMWWQASGDRPVKDPASLINMVVQGLGGYGGRHMEQSQNCLEYPASKYPNLRAGMPNE